MPHINLRDEGTTWWVPVYYEPILGSGERITIGVCAVNDVGMHVARGVKDFRILAMVIGIEASMSFQNDVESVFIFLEKQLAKEKNLAKLDPRLDGVTMGEVHTTPCRELTMTLTAALQRSSFLCGCLTNLTPASGLVGHA